MSKYLIDEYPLITLPTLAMMVGLHEAIILQQIHYWTTSANAQERDGHRWVYNSYAAWQKQMPFLSTGQITRAIHSLENHELLISANFNRLAVDNTKWYRIDYRRLEQASILGGHPSPISDASPYETERPLITSDKPLITSDKPLITSDKPLTASDKPLPETPTETTREKENTFEVLGKPSHVFDPTPEISAPQNVDILKFKDAFEVLREIPQFDADAKKDRTLGEWLGSREIHPSDAERVALAVASKWDGKKYKNVRATFRNWMLRELRTEPHPPTPLPQKQGVRDVDGNSRAVSWSPMEDTNNLELQRRDAVLKARHAKFAAEHPPEPEPPKPPTVHELWLQKQAAIKSKYFEEHPEDLDDPFLNPRTEDEVMHPTREVILASKQRVEAKPALGDALKGSDGVKDGTPPGNAKSGPPAHRRGMSREELLRQDLVEQTRLP